MDNGQEGAQLHSVGFITTAISGWKLQKKNQNFLPKSGLSISIYEYSAVEVLTFFCRTLIAQMRLLSWWYSSAVKFPGFLIKLASNDSGQTKEAAKTWKLKKWHQRVELHGHVVGIALDHSGRFLFANVRRWDQSGTSNIVLLPRWPLGAQPNRGEVPPIAQEIEMVVIDLNTLQILPKTYTGHKGFTPNSVKTLL